MCERYETRWERWFRIGLERGRPSPEAKENADVCEALVVAHEREEAQAREKECASEEAERLRTPAKIILGCMNNPRPYAGEWKANDLMREAIRAYFDIAQEKPADALRSALCAMIVEEVIECRLDGDGDVRIWPTIQF